MGALHEQNGQTNASAINAIISCSCHKVAAATQKHIHWVNDAYLTRLSMLLCCSRTFVATTWDRALIRHTVLMRWISTADLCMGTTVRSMPEIAMSQLHLVSHIDKVLLSQQGLCRSPDGRQCLGAEIKQGLCSQHQAPGSQSHCNSVLSCAM